MNNPMDRCVCSHPRAIHIGGGVCVRCGCGRCEPSAAGYTKEERLGWQEYLMAPDADWLLS